MLEIELQGARQVRRGDARGGRSVHRAAIQEALRLRLVGRGTDSSEQVRPGCETAERELEAAESSATS